MRPLVCLLLALVCLTLTARADAPSEPGTQRIYVGKGQIFTVTATRQLTLHAHVGQILYQPGSREAAYTTTQIDGDTETNCVKLMGLRTGQITTLLQRTAPVDGSDIPQEYSLNAWSGDGRYLIVAHAEVGTNTDSTSAPAASVWESVDVGVLPPKVRRILTPENVRAGSGLEGPLQPSPSGEMFAAGCLDPPQTGDKFTESAFLYDPANNTVRRIPLPISEFVRGWIDDTHLLLRHHDKESLRFFALDINTGKETAAKNKPAAAPPVPRSFPEVQLSLSTVPLPVPGPNPQSYAAGRALWLNIKGAKPKLPSLCLAVSLGTDDPDPILAPDQSSALWVQHGDLYASTFGPETATTREKYDAGEPLSCDEERSIATDNAKQLGLGLLQYVQDYDEQYPPAANFRDGVTPYVKDTGLFAVRQYPFHYAAPDDLSLANIDNPADTVLGTISLPCATVTLYADGHVKPLPPAAPGALTP